MLNNGNIRDGPAMSDTLDEPVLSTVLRDLKAIGRKLFVVVTPFLGRDNELRNWDLWGPLLLSLFLAMVMGGSATESQKGTVFATVFVLITLGSGLVTINAKFLGAQLSFFQTVCVMGYCTAPLCVAALIALVAKTWFITIPITGIAWAWACYASLRFFRGSVRTEREALVVYPVTLLYFFLSWMIAVGM